MTSIVFDRFTFSTVFQRSDIKPVCDDKVEIDHVVI